MYLEKLGQDIEESVKQLRQRTVEGSEVWKEKYGGGNLTPVFKSWTCIIAEEGIDFFFLLSLEEEEFRTMEKSEANFYL